VGIGDAHNEVLVSAATAWEISTKYRIGKLNHAAAVAADILGCLHSQGFVALDISLVDGQRAGLSSVPRMGAAVAAWPVN